VKGDEKFIIIFSDIRWLIKFPERAWTLLQTQFCPPTPKQFILKYFVSCCKLWIEMPAGFAVDPNIFMCA
jgi:hypothetical protein